MKKITFIFSALCLLIISSCSNENVLEDPINLDPNFRVSEDIIDGSLFSRASLDEPCYTTKLMAGQNYEAGTVTVDLDGNDLVITYTTYGDWTIDATHMSIGNCEDQEIPTTGSDNPKVGKFEHSTTHSDGVTVVEYRIDYNALTNSDGVLLDKYCFAAHAEVSGLTGGETAWAKGLDFGGNSWAMYVEAFLSDCDVDGGPPEEE